MKRLQLPPSYKGNAQLADPEQKMMAGITAV